jgi:hypothetical protein
MDRDREKAEIIALIRDRASVLRERISGNWFERIDCDIALILELQAKLHKLDGREPKVETPEPGLRAAFNKIEANGQVLNDVCIKAQANTKQLAEWGKRHEQVGEAFCAHDTAIVKHGRKLAELDKRLDKEHKRVGNLYDEALRDHQALADAEVELAELNKRVVSHRNSLGSVQRLISGINKQLVESDKRLRRHGNALNRAFKRVDGCECGVDRLALIAEKAQMGLGAEIVKLTGRVDKIHEAPPAGNSLICRKLNQHSVQIVELGTTICNLQSQARIAASRCGPPVPAAKPACEHPEDAREVVFYQGVSKLTATTCTLCLAVQLEGESEGYSRRACWYHPEPASEKGEGDTAEAGS